MTWTYRVTNTGNVPLSAVAVTDNQPGVTVSCPVTTLQPGADTTCTAAGTSVAGQYANVGTVTATGAGAPVSDTDPSHYFGVTAGIDIEKATNTIDADLPPGPFIPVGDAVTWTYVVTNTGNAPIGAVAVTDSMAGVVPTFVSGDVNSNTLLDLTETWTYQATGTASPGEYENVGSVAGTGPTGPVAGLRRLPLLRRAARDHPRQDDQRRRRQRLPTGPFVPVGGGVIWHYTFTNTGNVPLRFEVTDDQGVEVACPRILFVAAGTIVDLLRRRDRGRPGSTRTTEPSSARAPRDVRWRTPIPRTTSACSRASPS